MTEISKPDIVSGKLAKIIHTNPNPEAQWLLEHLGMRFPYYPPSRVELNPGTQLLLILTERYFRHPLVRPYILRRHSDPELRGLYLSPVNTIVSWKEHDQEIETMRGLSLNICAFIAQTNPNLYRAVRMVNPSPVEPEKWAAYSSILHGVTSWGAMETRAKQEGITDREELDYYHRCSIQQEELEPDNSQLDRSYLEEEAEQVETSVTQYKTIIEHGSDPQKLAKIYHFMGLARTVIGYYFVFEAMKGFRVNGLGIQEGLSLLITYPPETVTQLKHPLEYSLNLSR